MLNDTLRQRMGWLHAWTGYLFGLLLVIIFTCGSLAVFDTEVTRWMQPELAESPKAGLTDSGMKAALSEASTVQAKGAIPLVVLPSSRDPYVRVVHYNGTGFVGAAIDPETGKKRATHTTLGGTFFFNFHHGLYLPKPWGSIPTECAALFLIVTICAGVIIHLKKLLPEFLLLRVGDAIRHLWTDAHVAMGLLLMPFMLMMAFAGASLHAARLFPGIMHAHNHPSPKAASDSSNRQANVEQVQNMLAQSEKLFGKGNVGFFNFADNKIRFYRSDMASTIITRNNLTFTSPDLSGEIEKKPEDISNIMGWLAGLHFGRWAPYPVRFLYFLGGLSGSWLMSAGLVIFLMKRRPANQQRWIFKLGECAAIAVTTALPIGVLAYLISSRFIPNEIVQQTRWEVTNFFMVWLLASGLAGYRLLVSGYQRSWAQQFYILAALAFAITPIDLLTRAPRWYGVSWIYPGVDAVWLCIGLLALTCARRMRMS